MQHPTVETVERALPLAYTLASALVLFALSRKRIRLTDKSLPSEINDEDLPEESDPQSNIGDATHHDRFGHQSLSSVGIDLARLGLTSLELGLSLLLVVLPSHSGPDEWATAWEAARVISWSYFLILSFVRLVRPAVAFQFWVRPQMDLFYVLQWVLSSIRLHKVRDTVLDEPRSKWSLDLKLELANWFVLSLLLWVTLVTRPYQKPLTRAERDAVRTPSKEYASSLYSQLVFAWVNPLVYFGYHQPVNDIDLPELEEDDQAAVTAREFSTIKCKTFTRSLFWALKGEFFIQFLWAIPWCILVNASPYCMNKILEYMQCRECGPPTMDNYKWVFGLLFASFFQSICFQASLHRGRRIYVHLVSIVSTQVYQKALTRKDLSGPTDKDKSEEKPDDDDEKKKLNIANLIAVDLNQMVHTFSYLHTFYGFPVQFIFAGIQLYWLLGKAALVGIAFMMISFIFPIILFLALMRLIKDIMSTKDERIHQLNEMLSAIRIVKFFGWEAKFVEKIQKTRTKELDKVRQTFIQGAIATSIWMSVPLLNILVIFLAYVKLYGNELSASTMFTTIALFSIMMNTLGSVPLSIQASMHTAVSLGRISNFMVEEDIVRDTVITKVDSKASRRRQDHTDGHGASSTLASELPIVGFANATFNWPNKDEVDATKGTDTKKAAKKDGSASTEAASSSTAEPVVQERFQLKNITLDFPVEKLSVIVGPTGSGKSALLLALLGELERVKGAVYLPRLDNQPRTEGKGSGIAYAAQTAWLQNVTIRNNILFGKEYEEERYEAVMEGCALRPDMDILEFGDATEIGEQGITLSGGQKQRIALARAIYSDAKVLLLDDCLSAVDTHTGKKLFETLTGPLLAGRTLILVTHQVQLTMNAASLVVVLNNGEVLGHGTPDEVIEHGWVDQVSLPGSSDQDSEVSTLDGEAGVKKAKKASAGDAAKVAPKLVEDEKKVVGSVSWSVYQVYIKASGGTAFWLGMILVALLLHTIEIGKDAWLAVWANKLAESTGELTMAAFTKVTPDFLAQSIHTAFEPIKEHAQYNFGVNTFISSSAAEPVSFAKYLGIFVLINIVTMIAMVIFEFYALRGTIRAGQELHDRLLHKISRAKLRFFDKTPIGRVVNRFSADLEEVDEQVMQGLRQFINGIIKLVGIIFVISVNSPAFLIAAVFIVGIYGLIGALYVPISRDLKRLNSNSRSPILNHFNETLTGLTTIRAYGFERRFKTKNIKNLDDNNRTFFLLWSANRWLTWRVDFVGALVAFITGILVLGSWGLLAPGWAALSLMYSLSFTQTIVWLIRTHAENEMAMNSVERVSEYMDLEEEPEAIIHGSRPPPSWPHSGDIQIKNLSMRYSADTPEVLKNVSLHIQAGEKVGVVGRTGSGKSTLAISLFRFMEPTQGSITIDGIDISTIGLLDLRSNLTIIPQDAVLFKGTLRFNLDPFGERKDEDLWQALRQSHLIPESAHLENASSADSTPAVVPVEQESPSADATTKDKKDSDAASENEIVDPTKITLDTPVKENGANFSQGQRQLIALARALVRRSRIIIMDEATASVDFETDLKIQKTIREEMADATIVTIAHRIRTIADFDRVVVMHQGEIVEYDRPWVLMNQENSQFRQLCEQSTELDALMAIAEAKEQTRRR
ncbi:hypothetical protein EMPS_09060 [Entomortierella parvispora]|uniref:Uncharacterized protein n=1 Tax=Entomortierella parvispora TaxID=205924 RepID=A0A9P3HHG5_9FUNG|nr:hypothetical protein EMPS_09060 [Entomortierella parvispora]